MMGGDFWLLAAMLCVCLMLAVAQLPPAAPHSPLDQSLPKSPEPIDSVTTLLRSLLDETVYDPQMRPAHDTLPAVITIDLFIKNIGPVKEDTMVYQMDCYFRQNWLDERLAYSNASGINIIPLSMKALDSLWKPDTYFMNGKNSYLHTITTPNKLLRIMSNGKVLYSMRLTVKANCPMIFRKYPMDLQSCPLFIGSYAYTTAEVVYEWGKNVAAFESEDVKELAQFSVLGFVADNYSSYRPNKGFESVLEIRFVMKRQIGFFLLQIYLPSYMMVVLSWVSFWFNRESVQGRVTLGITTLLSCVTLSITAKEGLPQLEYSTALDVFLQMCFAFIFASLIEFAGVNYFTITNPHGGEKTKPPATLAMLVEQNTMLSKNLLNALVKMRTTSLGEGRAAKGGKEEKGVEKEHGAAQGEGAEKARKVEAGQEPTEGGAQPKALAQPTQPVQRPQQAPPAAAIPLSRSVDLKADTQQLLDWHEPTCLSLFFYCLCGNSDYRRNKTLQKPANHLNSTSQIDILARICFPVLFIILNIIYWVALIYF